MPESLTDIERDVLDYLIEYLRTNTYQPSIREIGVRIGISSTRRVSEILQSLAGKGWVERTPSRSRGIRVLGLAAAAKAVGPGADECAEYEAPRGEDASWMARALEQSRVAVSADEVPVGAVLVRRGEVMAESYNLTRTLADPTAHAEMVALRTAAARDGQQWLLDATLYVTLEPCAMCAGAIILARIARLVYATADPKTGMCGSLACIVQDRRLNHRVRLTRDVLGDEAAELMRGFFRARR